MNPIAPVATTPLTTSDITRLPGSSSPAPMASQQIMPTDNFVQPKKSSKLKKTIIGIVGLAAVAVVLKRFCPNLLKVDANNAKWTDYIKNGVTKVAEYAEWPFVKLKGCFSKGEEVAEAATSLIR